MMLTAKDIIEKKFEKVGKGYRADDVDAFLKEVSIAFGNLKDDFDENEKKIIKLVDKINEYREEEDAIKDAILGAQKQAKQVLFEADITAEKKITEATARAEQLIIATKEQYAEELRKLDNLKKEVSIFKSQLTDLYNRQLRLIMEIPEIDDEEDSEEVTEENTAVETKEETVVENTADTEYSNNYPYQNDTYRPNQSRFGDLKFGHNQNK